MNTYRVWMKDGQAYLVRASNQPGAEAQAVIKATTDTLDVYLSTTERRAATTIDRVELIGSDRTKRNR